MATEFPHGGAAGVWADTDGGLAKNPEKSDIRDWGGTVETGINTTEADIAAHGIRLTAVEAAQASGTFPVAGGPVACVAVTDIVLSGEQTIDGVLTATSRVLLTGQTDPAENGIYVSAAGAWARAADMNAAGECEGARVSVAGGATYAATAWVCISAVTTLGTDDIEFAVMDDFGDLVASKADVGHTHTATGISDSTEAGRSLLTAADVDAQKAALGLGTAAEEAADSFTLSTLVSAPERAGTEIVLRDKRGFRALRAGADRLRTSQYEISPDRLRGGGFDIVPSATGGVRIRDSRGFWFEPVGARTLFRSTDKDGFYIRDARGFTVRLDQPGTAEPKTTPLHTNGAGLWQFRLMLARLAAGDATTARIMLLGDSWHQHAYIAQAVMNLLYDRYGQGADGWISPTHDSSGAADENCNDIAVSFSGWTEMDVTDDGGTVADPWSITADYLEATGTLATWTATGLRAETIHILYQDGDGTFRYRIDGGSWVVVAGTDSGDPAKVTVSGLSTGATHTVELDTVGNTGTARYCGLYCTGIDGVEVSKCGNGGADSLDWDRIMASPMLAYILDLVDPHAATICLGTNDISNAVPPLDYRAAIEGMIDVIRAVSPDCGIVLDPPNECFRAGIYVVADYTEQCADMAEDGDDVEFINMMDLIGPYSSTQNLGIWRDNSHMNDLGGRLFAGHLVNTFFII
ncbi:SGNH/GDSL hydrolase family protein [Chachezhania sediminis]|uniref:SGNH/GDSL hydrolase family protein n=1 Tax=Chachezhania sediminis TaxID=2599291 RepID=UPI00131E73FE|nr:SGNH/GDSL hydrolase family protein [Chachezhania sediminis]